MLRGSEKVTLRGKYLHPLALDFACVPFQLPNLHTSPTRLAQGSSVQSPKELKTESQRPLQLSTSCPKKGISPLPHHSPNFWTSIKKNFKMPHYLTPKDEHRYIHDTPHVHHWGATGLETRYHAPTVRDPPPLDPWPPQPCILRS